MARIARIRRFGWALVAALVALGMAGAEVGPATRTAEAAVPGASVMTNAACAASAIVRGAPASPLPTVVATPTARLRSSGLRVVRSVFSYRHGARGAKLTFTARAQGRAGTGAVRVKVAGRRHTVRLAEGKATYRMSSGLKPGTYPITATYRKNAGYRLVTVRTSVTVKPGATGLSLARSATSYRENRTRAKVTIKAKAAGRAGTGKVTVTVAGKTYRRALSGGKATFTMPARLKPARYTIKATYRKNANYRKVTKSTSITVRVKRKTVSAASQLSSAWNFRDVAGAGALGYKTADGGRLAKGVIYRSNVLALNATDAARIRNLGVTKIYDLRRATEIAKTPDRRIAGVRWVNVDILSTGGTGGMDAMYRGFVTNGAYRAELGSLLRDIAASPDPVVFHCQAGKDRTGWTAALLQSIAGVPRATIMSDYLASNTYLNGTLKPGDSLYQKRVKAAWLKSTFNQVTQTYGSMDNYLRKGLKLTDRQLAALRAKLLA